MVAATVLMATGALQANGTFDLTVARPPAWYKRAGKNEDASARLRLVSAIPKADSHDSRLIVPAR